MSGLENLKSDSNKLVIFESEDVELIDDIYEKTEQIYHYVKSIDPEWGKNPYEVKSFEPKLMNPKHRLKPTKKQQGGQLNMNEQELQ